MLDLRYTRQVHIEAPRELVQHEVSDLRQLLTYAPHDSRVTVSADGRSGRSRKVVAYGPFRRTLDISAELTERAAAGGVELVAREPDLKLDLHVALRLATVGPSLTVADCDAAMACAHARADWLRTPLLNSLQSKVDEFVATLAARLAQFARAERVFGELAS